MVLPKSLSASALKVAEGCPARYHAEHIERGANIQGEAANLGITLHGALERFIMGVKIRKDTAWDLEILLSLYDKMYEETIGPDHSRPEYRDGKQLLRNWFHRDYIFDDIFGATTISVEAKNNFDVPVIYEGAKVIIPFNYIFDRLDKISDEEYRIVDYKSGRFPISPEDLRDDIQARAYALAVAIKFKGVKKIWVEFDFLRHEKIGVVFTREDNIATYKYILRAAQRIVDLDADKLPEVLNKECGWCIRKVSCAKLASNVAAGGAFSLDLNGTALKYHDVSAQVKALTVLKNDLEKDLILHATNDDTSEIDTEGTRVRITAKMSRSVDQEAVRRIIGDEIYSQYRNGIKLGDLDDLDARVDLTSGQKAAIKACVTRAPGNPSVKVVKRNAEF
jgi:RecB family exonuclease